MNEEEPNDPKVTAQNSNSNSLFYEAGMDFGQISPIGGPALF